MVDVETKSSAGPPVDGAKQNVNNNEVDQTQFPTQGPSGQPFPPPNFAFYNYPPGHPPPPPGPDGNADPNAPAAAPNGEPIPYPPGMYPYVYPQPPPGYMPVSMSGMPIPGALIKPKRKQVKMACTNCAAACKRCDIGRPCERCIKYGLAESCRDGVRKERKKGFKRGPYNKPAQNNPNGEWNPAGPNAGPFPGPPPQGAFPPAPEGYYPAFYALAPPPGSGPALVPVQPGAGPENPDGQPDGAVDPSVQGQNGDGSQHPHPQPPFPPPHAQFVYPPHLPPGYPFYFPPPQHPPPPQAPPPQAHPQHPASQSPAQPQEQQQQPPEQPPTSKKKRATANETLKDDDEDEEEPPTPPRKKRGRRSSDADWPGSSKKGSKKADGAGPTRRSARRGHAQPQSQTQPPPASLESNPHMDSNKLNESIVNASNHEIVGSTEDPVIQSRA